MNLTGGLWSMVAADCMRFTACGCRTCTAKMNVFDSGIRRLADAEDIRTKGGAAYYKMKSAPKSAVEKNRGICDVDFESDRMSSRCI